MPDASSHRLYDDKEISRILKRAAEIQNEEGTGPTYGLSLEELKQVAAETGLDPAHILAAAAELERGAAFEKTFHVLGGPMSISKARVVKGGAREEQWEEMIAEIRRTMGMVGSTSQVGQSLEWTFHSRFQEVQVTATSRDGQTKLRADQQIPKLALATFAPLTVISLQLLIILLATLSLGTLPGIGLSITVVMTMLLMARAIFGWIAHTKERKMDTLLDRLERIVERSDKEAAVLKEKAAALDPIILDADAVVSEEQRLSGTRSKTAS